MAYDLKNTKQYLPANSIISGNPEGDDMVRPFIFTDWVDRLGNVVGSQESLKEEYNKYVRLWKEQKELKRDFQLETKSRYIDLLKNITLNYTTDEEKRFLTNVDYSKPRHLEAAIVFYSKKLKDISLYMSKERENIKYSTGRKTNSGTKKSLKSLVHTEIDNIIDRLQLSEKKLIDNKELGKKVVKIVDLFATQNEVNKEYEIDFDPEIFNDLSTAIENILTNCAPLLELSEGLLLSVTEQVDRDEETIEQLDYSWFYNYIKDLNNLNLFVESDYVRSILGGDQYIVNSETAKELTSAITPWRDLTNRGKPVINRLQPIQFESIYTTGLMGVPKNLGTLTYYSYAPMVNQLPAISGSSQDITKFGSNIIETAGDVKITYHEDITWLKADSSNDGLFGDIVDSSNMPRFFSYRSDIENQYITQLGVSRPTDPMGFFTGPGNLTWANEDVFKRDIENVYPINERQETLLVGHETTTKWFTDIFGNEYALYKEISLPRDPEIYAAGESIDDFVTDSLCQIIDGGDTLKPRPLLWTKGVEYKIIEGGRRGGIDPKIEQRLNMTDFEDLRRVTTLLNSEGTPVQALEPYNTYYLAPNPRHTELVITKISFHGFLYEEEQPVYDRQAYCGLFTDETCGRIDASGRECVIRDNYAFGTFSDLLSTYDIHARAVNEKGTITVTTVDTGLDKSQWSIVINVSQPEENLTFTDGTFVLNFTQNSVPGREITRLLNTSDLIYADGGDTYTPATSAESSFVFPTLSAGWSSPVKIINPVPGVTDVTLTGDGIRTIKQLAEASGLVAWTWWPEDVDQIMRSGESIRITGGTNEILAVDTVTETTVMYFSGGQDDYYTSASQQLTSQTDAFEEYINTDFDGGELLSFGGNSPLSSVVVFESEDIDGSRFGDDLCDPGDAEYVTNESRVSKYFDYRDNVSRTKYSQIPENTLDHELTLYEAKSLSKGKVVFRSSDSYIVDNILNVLSESLVRIGSPSYRKYDREILRDQLENGEIRDMEVYHDVIAITTKTHFYAEKMIYNGETRQMIRSSHPSLIIKTTTDDNVLETCFQNYHNTNANVLVCGHTRRVSINEIDYPQPIIYLVDLNNMTTKSLVVDESELTLTDSMSGFHFVSVDIPVVTYNDFVDLYTVSYSCKLKNDNGDISYGVCVLDIEDRSNGLRVITNNIYHTDPTMFIDNGLQEWESKINKQTLSFPKNIPVPTSTDLTYEIDMKNVFGKVFDQYTLDLTIDTRTLPVDNRGSKINRIIFNPGDGSKLVYRNRELQTGLEPINFDISELPDQSDFADPRINQIRHVYNFRNSDITTYTPTIEIVYANFKKLTITILLETTPYTVQTAFDDIKLIDTKTYTDKLGKFRQLLTLETQNPKSVTDVIILKDIYTSSTVIGYVDGKRYAGPSHTMSDGSLMTGDIHTPFSRAIIPI